jgi:hypothetical protein
MLQNFSGSPAGPSYKRAEQSKTREEFWISREEFRISWGELFRVGTWSGNLVKN